MPIFSKSCMRAAESTSDCRTSTWSAMPSLPATISCRMPSMSSPGSATMLHALENAVWPVRPISQESTRVTRVPGGPWRLADSAASSPPAPAPTTRTSVSIKTPSSLSIVLIPSGLPWPRPVFHRRMHVDDVLRAENLAAEAGDAMLAEFDDRQELGLPQAGNLRRNGLRLHVDHISRADHVTDAAAGAFVEF